MYGRVFHIHKEGGDQKQFTKTLEALHEYSQKMLPFSGDMWKLTMAIKEPLLTKPTAILATKANLFIKAKFAEDVSSYVAQKQ